MTVLEAIKLTRESDPNQLEFYSKKPISMGDLEYIESVFDKIIREEIKIHFSFNYSGTVCASFSGQWNNELLKQYALEQGFNISPDANQSDLIVTWTTRAK